MIDLAQIYQNNHPGNLKPTDILWGLRAPYTPGNDFGVTAEQMLPYFSQMGFYGVDTGTTNNIVINISSPISVYPDGQMFVFKSSNNNSGATTLNVNGFGARAIYTNPNYALVGGEIFTNGIYVVLYNTSLDGFILINSSHVSSTPVTTVTASSYQLAVNSRYYINRPSLVMLDMPTSSNVGDIIEIINMNDSFQIAQPVDMNIRIYNKISTTGTSGYIRSDSVGDQITLECMIADSLWFASSAVGNLTVF